MEWMDGWMVGFVVEDVVGVIKWWPFAYNYKPESVPKGQSSPLEER